MSAPDRKPWFLGAVAAVAVLAAGAWIWTSSAPPSGEESPAAEEEHPGDEAAAPEPRLAAPIRATRAPVADPGAMSGDVPAPTGEAGGAPTGGAGPPPSVPTSVAAYADTIEEARRLVSAGHVDEGIAAITTRAASAPPLDHDRLVLFAARLLLGQNHVDRVEATLAQATASNDPSVKLEADRLRSLVGRVRAAPAAPSLAR